jgi:histidinol-phosphate aminotransferase
VGNPVLIKYLNDVKYSFNSYTMNQTSLALGTAAVKDEAYFRETLNKIVATRERTKRELAELGFTFPDSQANFIFASHRTCPARELFEALKQKNIYVRYFNAPRIDNYLRITVGTDEQMDALLTFLREYLTNK